MINNLFTEVEASSILRMPISSLGTKDRLVWKYSPNRQYSVRSGYQRIQEGGRMAKKGEESSTKVEDDRIM